MGLIYINQSLNFYSANVSSSKFLELNFIRYPHIHGELDTKILKRDYFRWFLFENNNSKNLEFNEGCIGLQTLPVFT